MKISRRETRFLLAVVLLCACLPMLTRDTFPPQPKADAISTDELYGAIELQRLVRERPHQKQFTVVWREYHNRGKGWSVLKFDATRHSLHYKMFSFYPEGWVFTSHFPFLVKNVRYLAGCPREFHCDKVTVAQVRNHKHISIGTLLTEAGCNSGCMVIT